MRNAAIILVIIIFFAVVAFSIHAANVRKDATITKESTVIIYENEEEEELTPLREV